ncbi:retrovirus-related pol polyprotein from transposon TNT 1-94 [Tanacetum coccineum]
MFVTFSGEGCGVSGKVFCVCGEGGCDSGEEDEAITQHYSTPTNNRLRTSSNTRNQAVIQDGRVDIQRKNKIEEYDQNVQRVPRTESTPEKTNVQCYNCNGRGHYARDCPKPRVRDAKYFREQMLLATKDEAGVHLDEEENDFMLDNAYGDNTLEELNAAVIMMACIQPTNDKSDAEPTYDAELISENPKHLKKAIAAQPKIYNGNSLNNKKEKIDLHDYEETLEDAEKSRLKMKDKMIPLDYPKLNALYESFVPQTKITAEQTYISSPSTSNESPESSSKKSDLPPKKMPNESQLLIVINIHHKKNKDISFIYDNKADIRRIFTLEVVSISRTLNECSKEIKQEITAEVHEMLNNFESMERKVEEQSQKDELFQKEIDRLLEVSLEREVRDCVLISVEQQRNEMLLLEKEKNLK